MQRTPGKTKITEGIALGFALGADTVAMLFILHGKSLVGELQTLFLENIPNGLTALFDLRQGDSIVTSWP